VRSLGSTLSLPYVARGRVSAYVCFEVTAIHGAAGVLLTTEAGGTVSEIDGSQWCLESDSIIAAATASLHEQVLGLIAMNPG
jgi:myo-inositol-1(or 4)-monophosphatase